jgi:hypothetical protein
VAPWVDETKTRLLAGEVHHLLTEWAGLPGHDAGAWAAEQTYFRNQAHRMAYDRYRQAGYPLGSGAVESANRHVVGVRVKQAGMHWGSPRSDRRLSSAGHAPLAPLGRLVGQPLAPRSAGRLTIAMRTRSRTPI